MLFPKHTFSRYAYVYYTDFPFFVKFFRKNGKILYFDFLCRKDWRENKIRICHAIHQEIPTRFTPIPTIHAIATYGCAVANERRLSFSRKYAIMIPTKEVFYEKYQRTNLFISDEMRTFSA